MRFEEERFQMSFPWQPAKGGPHKFLSRGTPLVLENSKNHLAVFRYNRGRRFKNLDTPTLDVLAVLEHTLF